MSNGATETNEPLDQASGLLPVDPPARGARWAGWLLLAIAVTVILFATTFPLPETVIAPFRLVPAEGEDPLQSPVSAEIAFVGVQEGATVTAGQELFRLRSNEIRDARARVSQLTEDNRALGERVRRLDEAHTAGLAIKDAEIFQAERELIFREKHLETIREIVRRSEQLAAAGSVSPVEMLGHKLVEAESLKNQVVTEKLRQQLAFQREEMVSARARQRSDEHAEAEKLRVQIAALEQQLQDTTGDLKSIRAPYDAVVLTLLQRTPGGVVSAGADLCHLARTEARPRAQLLLPQSGMPRLQIGLPVRLFVESYPYQRNGTFAAHVAWISPAPVTVGDQRHFIALADLPAVPASRLQLRVGMTGEARVRVGRQTLFQRSLEPLRGARERLRAE